MHERASDAGGQVVVTAATISRRPQRLTERARPNDPSGVDDVGVVADGGRGNAAGYSRDVGADLGPVLGQPLDEVDIIAGTV